MYAENAWDRADEFAQYLTEVITYRSDEGHYKLNVNEFVVDSLEVWRSEGWLGTEVEKLDTKLLNATTSVFDIKWRDLNHDGSTEYECGWYFADKIEEKWLLSQHIVMACPD
ncbi:MAG: hypothetical protein QNI98_00850 [Woeseiaceae bacterium]|nr:hypothetical protein [Woeseiaceae bacterium]